MSGAGCAARRLLRGAGARGGGPALIPGGRSGPVRLPLPPAGGLGLAALISGRGRPGASGGSAPVRAAAGAARPAGPGRAGPGKRRAGSAGRQCGERRCCEAGPSPGSCRLCPAGTAAEVLGSGCPSEGPAGAFPLPGRAVGRGHRGTGGPACCGPLARPQPRTCPVPTVGSPRRCRTGAEHPRSCATPPCPAHSAPEAELRPCRGGERCPGGESRGSRCLFRLLSSSVAVKSAGSFDMSSRNFGLSC